MKKDVVVLLSGGIDSTTCAAEAVAHYGNDNVLGLTMFYGQKHDKELEAAKAVAEDLGIELLVRDLSSVFVFDNNPLLSKSTEELPKGSYDEQLKDNDGMAKTYVPFRNGLFLSYASAIAYSVGASKVYYGAHADDAAGNAYPDCSVPFYTAMNEAVFEGTGKKVSLEAPIINLNKSEVVERGLMFGAPFELTWSCYEGQEKACGECSTCIDRKRAFKDNGLVDPIPYK